MKKNMQGFSLIELMIVVALIAILTAIAVPIYQNYTVRTQAAAALAEIAPGKTGYELAIANNHTPTVDDTQLGYINIKGTTTYCINTIDATGISCATQGGSSDFGGHEIKLARSSAGEWTCTSDLDSKFKPTGCT